MNNVKSFPPEWCEFDSNNFGGGAIFRIYTSDDIVLQGTSEKYIVDEEVVRAVFQSINNKTQMPSICYASIGSSSNESTVHIPQQLNLDFGTALNSRAFGFVIAGTTYYIFDTYQNAYDYYNR